MLLKAIAIAVRAFSEAKVKQHLKMWRTVKKNPGMVSAPSFWRLAQMRGLSVPSSVGSSPRTRNMLDAHASCTNILNEYCVLDVSQSVDRTALRQNGEMLTLTRTCGNIFVPNACVKLSVQQCFAMQGYEGPLARPWLKLVAGGPAGPHAYS